MAAAAPSVDPAAAVSSDIATAAGDKPASPQSPEKPEEKAPFEVVVDSANIKTEEYMRSPKVKEEEEDNEVIEPAYYYDDGTIPVFTPVGFRILLDVGVGGGCVPIKFCSLTWFQNMDQFRSFKKYVNKINHYGMAAGIVKIIPPKEWYNFGHLILQDLSNF